MSNFWRRFLAALTHSGPGYDTTAPHPPAAQRADAKYAVAALPRRFHLLRHIDVSGISGTGIVADGVQWPDGTASLRWRGERPSAVHWDRIADAEAVHGHAGATEFVWLDQDITPPADQAVEPESDPIAPFRALADQYAAKAAESTRNAKATRRKVRTSNQGIAAGWRSAEFLLRHTLTDAESRLRRIAAETEEAGR